MTFTEVTYMKKFYAVSIGVGILSLVAILAGKYGNEIILNSIIGILIGFILANTTLFILSSLSQGVRRRYQLRKRSRRSIEYYR